MSIEADLVLYLQSLYSGFQQAPLSGCDEENAPCHSTNATIPGGSVLQRPMVSEYADQLKVDLWRIHRLGEKPRRTWQEAIVRWMQDKDDKADHHKDIAKLKWFNQFLRNHYLDEINRDVVDHIGATKKAEASASTANRYLALLRAILRRARDDWEWIELIPRVRLFPEPKKESPMDNTGTGG